MTEVITEIQSGHQNENESLKAISLIELMTPIAQDSIRGKIVVNKWDV